MLVIEVVVVSVVVDVVEVDVVGRSTLQKARISALQLASFHSGGALCAFPVRRLIDTHMFGMTLPLM